MISISYFAAGALLAATMAAGTCFGFVVAALLMAGKE